MASEDTFLDQHGSSSAAVKKLSRKDKIKLAHNKYSLTKRQSVIAVEPVSAKIIYGSGNVDIEASGDVYGIQMKYSGNMNITSKHKKASEMSLDSGGWIMLANNATGRLLYFSFNGKPINGISRLFTYRGNVTFSEIIVSGQSTQIRGLLKRATTDKFKDLDTAFNKVDVSFKNLRNNGKAKSTPKMFTGYETKSINQNPRRANKTKSKGMGGKY